MQAELWQRQGGSDGCLTLLLSRGQVQALPKAAWAVHLWKPIIVMASMQDSVPPASMASASPPRMAAQASPMASAPAAQAVLHCTGQVSCLQMA